MYFKVHLKKHRKNRGLTQKELAKKSNLSQQYIADLEKSDRTKSPTLDTIANLSLALEVCPFSLIEFNCIQHCEKHNYCTRQCY